MTMSTLKDSPRPPVWDDAACRGHNPDLWFPSEVGVPKAPVARSICGACPIQRACAEYAIPIVELRGIWGGLSEGERRHVRDRRNPPTGVCLCGCTETDHPRRWQAGGRKRGPCISCGCDEYVGDGGG